LGMSTNICPHAALQLLVMITQDFFGCHTMDLG